MHLIDYACDLLSQGRQSKKEETQQTATIVIYDRQVFSQARLTQALEDIFIIQVQESEVIEYRISYGVGEARSFDEVETL